MSRVSGDQVALHTAREATADARSSAGESGRCAKWYATAHARRRRKESRGAHGQRRGAALEGRLESAGVISAEFFVNGASTARAILMVSYLDGVVPLTAPNLFSSAALERFGSAGCCLAIQRRPHEDYLNDASVRTTLYLVRASIVGVTVFGSVPRSFRSVPICWPGFLGTDTP